MVTKPKTSQKKRRAKSDCVYYTIEIQDWHWSFWFGVSRTRYFSGGPYDDYRHLVVKGKLLAPAKMNVRSIELSFLPSQKLNEGYRENDEPITIGSLSLLRGYLTGRLSMPADILPSLLTIATAGRLRYVIIQGDKLFRGHGRMNNFRFETTLDPDDIP